MQIQITPNQCLCSFGDGIVYEFVPTFYPNNKYSCLQCVFWSFLDDSFNRKKCHRAPCQKPFRNDEKRGFWQISQTVDYQEFIKMLENGG